MVWWEVQRREARNGKVWDRIMANLSIPDISVSSVVNKVHSLKADYRAFCTLKKQTGVGWNYETNTVDVDDAWWDKFILVWAHLTCPFFVLKNYIGSCLLPFTNLVLGYVLKIQSCKEVLRSRDLQTSLSWTYYSQRTQRLDSLCTHLAKVAKQQRKQPRSRVQTVIGTGPSVVSLRSISPVGVSRLIVMALPLRTPNRALRSGELLLFVRSILFAEIS